MWYITTVSESQAEVGVGKETDSNAKTNLQRLASTLSHSIISESAINHWEQHACVPSDETLHQWSQLQRLSSFSFESYDRHTYLLSINK